MELGTFRSSTENRRLRRYAIGAAGAALLWLLVGYLLAPPIIGAAWGSENLLGLDRIMQGRGRQPLESYIDAWRRLRLRLSLGMAALAAAGFISLLLGPVIARRAQVLLEQARVTRRGAVAVAAWLGVTLGAAQAAVVLLKQAVAPRPDFLYSWDVVWMAPAATAVVFTLFGVAVASFSHIFPLVLSWRALVFIGAGAWVYGIVRSAALGVHPAAALLVAIGIGIHVPDRLLRHRERLHRWIRTSLATLLPVTAIVAAFRIGAQVLPVGLPQRLAAASGPAEHPNVLLIILDTVRKQNLSLYGYERTTTPWLDDFARRGVVFDAAVTPSSWTLPSHASLFTGLQTHELQVDWQRALEPGPATLAEVLAGLGYATGGFVANVWYAGKASGLSRGFEVYRDHRVNLRTVVRSAWVTHTIADALTYESADILDRKTASDVNNEFLEWLNRQDGRRPFFAFLNYFDAHYPYGAPERFRTQFAARPQARAAGRPQAGAAADDGDQQPVPVHLRRDRDLYDAGIAYMDHELGRLLDALEKRGVLHETVVVITSDHGEQFGELRGDLIAHGNSLYYSTVAVPLVVVFPPAVPAGGRVGATVETRMIAATVMDLVAAGRAVADTFQGPSLAEYWGVQAGTTMARQAASVVNPGPWAAATDPVSQGSIWSLISGRTHYIRNGDGTEELYDIAADPWNQRNLVGRADHEKALTSARRRFAALASCARRDGTSVEGRSGSCVSQ